jgi:hypothetical protein
VRPYGVIDTTMSPGSRAARSPAESTELSRDTITMSAASTSAFTRSGLVVVTDRWPWRR